MNDKKEYDFTGADMSSLSDEETKQAKALLKKINANKEKREATEEEIEKVLEDLEYEKNDHMSYFFGNFNRIHEQYEDTLHDLIGYDTEGPSDEEGVTFKDIQKVYKIMCEKLDKIKKEIDKEYAALQPICEKIATIKKKYGYD